MPSANTTGAGGSGRRASRRDGRRSRPSCPARSALGGERHSGRFEGEDGRHQPFVADLGVQHLAGRRAADQDRGGEARAQVGDRLRSGHRGATTEEQHQALLCGRSCRRSNRAPAGGVRPPELLEADHPGPLPRNTSIPAAFRRHCTTWIPPAIGEEREASGENKGPRIARFVGPKKYFPATTDSPTHLRRQYHRR